MLRVPRFDLREQQELQTMQKQLKRNKYMRSWVGRLRRWPLMQSTFACSLLRIEWLNLLQPSWIAVMLGDKCKSHQPSAQISIQSCPIRGQRTYYLMFNKPVPVGLTTTAALSFPMRRPASFCRAQLCHFIWEHEHLVTPKENLEALSSSSSWVRKIRSQGIFHCCVERADAGAESWHADCYSCLAGSSWSLWRLFGRFVWGPKRVFQAFYRKAVFQADFILATRRERC